MSLRRQLELDNAFNKDIDYLIDALIGMGKPDAMVKATNRGINKIKGRIVSRAVPKAAISANLSKYHIRRKLPASFQHNATPKRPRAKITVRRTDMAAISLFARPTNSRKGEYKKGDLDKNAIATAKRQAKHGKVLKVGKGKHARTYTSAFISKGTRREQDPKYDEYLTKRFGAGKKVLRDRYFHVLKRVGAKPYPLDVVKIPLKHAMTGAFRFSARAVLAKNGQAAKLMGHEVLTEVKRQTGTFKRRTK